MPATPYTPEQNAYLRSHYATATRAEIMTQFPGRYWRLIQNQAGRIGLTGELARQHAKRPATAWTPPAPAYLRTNYPAYGPAPVAAFTGLTVAAVRSAAAREGVRRLILPKPTPAQKLAQRLAKKVAKAAVVKPAVPLLSVQRSPLTPNLNVQKEGRRQSQEAPKRAAGITADAIRKLGYNDPQRMAYTLGGVAGWQQWRATEAAAGR